MGVSGLDALVGAATEGMRKTQSADEIAPEATEPAPAPAKDGHLSDSAVAPTRERKKGACFLAGGTRSLFVSRAPPRLATPRATSKRERPTDAHLYSLPSPAGVPWTEDEHRLFLLGLQKLGKVRRGKIESHRQARGSSPRASARAREQPRRIARVVTS